MFDDERELPPLSIGPGRQECLGVCRMKTCGRLVQHVHDAEQIGSYLMASRSRWSSPGKGLGCFVPATNSPARGRAERRFARQILGNALRDERFFRMFGQPTSPSPLLSLGIGAQNAGQPLQRHPRDFGDVQPAKVTERLRAKSLAMALRAFAAHHVLRHPLLHQRTLRIGKGCSTYRLALVNVP